MKEKPRQVVSGVRLRRNYPKIAKKSPPIREVKEVRDDKAACSLIQLSQELDVGSPDVRRWSRYGYRPKKVSEPGSRKRPLVGPTTRGFMRPQVRPRRSRHVYAGRPAHVIH